MSSQSHLTITTITNIIINNIKVISYIPNDSCENINILLDDLEGNEVKRNTLIKLASKIGNKNLLEDFIKDLLIICLQEYNKLTECKSLSSNDLSNFVESFSNILHDMTFKYDKIHLKGTLYLIEFIMKCLFFVKTTKPEDVFIFTQLVSSSIKLCHYDFNQNNDKRKCCCLN